MPEGDPMLPDTVTSKVTAAHLSRRAVLYVRQSSLKQVIHNTESAIRQYDLRGKAIALGWAADQVTVIDIDQRHSGASAAGREGFQQMVAEVALGRAGIVLGLECSRLARNNADWHQLLEIGARPGTLICDEDGLYDPRASNDRLVLGMKGQISEYELHFIRARLRGGILSKARRGELIMPLPAGLTYDAAGHVILDPDTAIQGAVRHLLTTFEATGSATAVVKAFRAAGLTFPWRHLKGPRKGETDWQPLRHSTVLHALHNPRYAGAFTYGRHREQLLPGGKRASITAPRHQWISFIPGAHPGYITLEQWEANIARLAANAAAHGPARAAVPPPPRRPRQPARRRPPRSRLEPRAARPGRRPGGLRQGPRTARRPPHTRPEGPDQPARHRPARHLARPRHPHARAQAHRPAAAHRRHRHPHQRHHHRARPPGRRPAPHPHPASPPAGLENPADQSQHHHRDRQPAGPPHLRRDPLPPPHPRPP